MFKNKSIKKFMAIGLVMVFSLVPITSSANESEVLQKEENLLGLYQKYLPEFYDDMAEFKVIRDELRPNGKYLKQQLKSRIGEFKNNRKLDFNHFKNELKEQIKDQRRNVKKELKEAIKNNDESKIKEILLKIHDFHKNHVELYKEKLEIIKERLEEVNNDM